MDRCRRASVVWILLGCRPAEDEGRALPEPPTLTDRDPSPDRVEVWLDAVSTELELGGTRQPVWAYRDGAGPGAPSVPGPLLRVRPGQHLHVELRNELPDSTTLHLHGVVLPNEMDGSEMTQMLGRSRDDGCRRRGRPRARTRRGHGLPLTRRSA